MAVLSGDCYRCKHGALLYPATLQDGRKIGLCYECRETVRRVQRAKAEELRTRQAD